VLHDITTGNNDTDGLLGGQFATGTAWDACAAMAIFVHIWPLLNSD
jgi:hypothetical protein